MTTPDLTRRPFQLTVERLMQASPARLYRAWTQHFGTWFAEPGTVLMDAKVNSVFFFETVYKPEGTEEASRHPHYGRFLRLEPDRLVEITWVTGAGGTEGAETIVTVEFTQVAQGTKLRLTHAGFATEKASNQHEAAWPLVLEQLDRKISTPG